MYLSKSLNVFAQIVKSQWSSPIHLEHLFHHSQRSRQLYDASCKYENEQVFVQIDKYVCQNCWSHLSKSEDIFVQIAKYICPNCKIPVIFSYSSRAPIPSSSASPPSKSMMCHASMRMNKYYKWIYARIAKCICPNQKKSTNISVNSNANKNAFILK